MASPASSKCSKETALTLVDQLGFERRKIVQQAVIEDSARYKDKDKDSNSTLPSGVSWIIAEYVVDKGFFLGHEWRTVWNHIVDEREITQEFYKFWYGRDPIDPSKFVCDTHTTPTLRPEFVTDITNGAKKDHCLDTLGQIVSKPLRGHASGYQSPNTTALIQNGKNKAGPAMLRTIRKEVFARGLPYAEQTKTMEDVNTKTGAGYEEEPAVLDGAACVFAHQALTGERVLGDNTGAEGSYTASRFKETVIVNGETYQVTAGGNEALGDEVGAATGGLLVYYIPHYSTFDSLGVVGLR